MGERTTLSINTILELLTFCVKTTFFQYKNDFYTQDVGMAMGSPLSPFLSNIFMEHFENNFVQNYNWSELLEKEPSAIYNLKRNKPLDPFLENTSLLRTLCRLVLLLAECARLF